MHKPPNTQFVAHDFACLDTCNFSAMDYSKLKFGSDSVARAFGHEMADKFYAEHKDLLLADKIVVIPSAFNVVKIAATILAEHFMNRLNDLLTRDDHQMVDWTTMHRSMSYIADYAFLDKAERARLLSDDKLFINRDFVEGKVLVFVDDVTITGTHEDKIVQFLADQGLTNPTIFAYYARYKGAAAEIEAALNHSGISTVQEYLDLIQEPRHHMVVRAVRFLLDKPLADLAFVLNKADFAFITDFYYACLAKGYDKLAGYRAGFELVRERFDMGDNYTNVAREVA